MASKLILLLFTVALAAFGQSLSDPNFIASLKPAAATSGGGADVTENFEGTGYENSWTEETGNADPDFSTTGLSMEASQCIYTDGNNNQEETYVSFTASDNVYTYFLLRFEDAPSATRQQIALKNGSTFICNMSAVNGPTTWRVADNSLTDLGSVPSIDTTYHCWFEYEKGTGANGKIRWYFSTDGTKPGTADCEITNSAETAQANRFYIGTWGTGGGNFYVDKVRISRTTAFGSNPS